MNKIIFAILTSTSCVLMAEEISDKTSQLDHLIEATKENLNAQIILKQSIAEYQHLFESYVNNPEDKQLLLQVTKSAHRIIESIKHHHLEQLFDPKFLGELSLFDQVANKRGIPKP